MNGGKAYFRKLNQEEKESKFLQLKSLDTPEIHLWVRGSDKKVPCSVASFDKQKLSLGLFDIPDHLLKEKNVLFTFYLNKVQYFGEGDLESVSGSASVVLKMKGEVYKTEKRESFRLLCYPHNEVYFYIEVDKEDEGANKVINIRTGKNEDELFDSFLDLIGKNTKDLQGYAKFRVIDVSVTGLAFQYGKEEEEFIKNIDISNRKIFLGFGFRLFIFFSLILVTACKTLRDDCPS